MVHQTGNGIDEFVIDTLRNNLLGLPLDLATINMARARDAGVPPLQEAARAVLRRDRRPGAASRTTAGTTSGRRSSTRASLVNFVAAYGDADDPRSTPAARPPPIAERRAAAPTS